MTRRHVGQLAAIAVIAMFAALTIATVFGPTAHCPPGKFLVIRPHDVMSDVKGGWVTQYLAECRLH